MAKLPHGGIAAIILIFAAEVAFYFATEPLTGVPLLQPAADDAIMAAKRALMPQAAGRVLLVGDSSCLFGLRPDIIERESGFPTINLGTTAFFAAAGFVSMAEDAINASASPTAIVLVFYPDTLSRTAEETRDVELLGRYLIAYRATSDYYQPTLYERWCWFARKHRFNILSDEFCSNYQTFAQTLAEKRGYFPESHSYVGSQSKREEFRCDDYSLRPIRDIVDLAAKRNIPVVFWMSPVPNDAVTDQHIAQQNECLRSNLFGIEELIVPQTEPPVLAKEWFATRTHVTPAGAVENSRKLGAALRDILSTHTQATAQNVAASL